MVIASSVEINLNYATFLNRKFEPSTNLNLIVRSSLGNESTR